MVRESDGLAPGEKDVLLKIAKGYSIRYVALLRGTSTNTVQVQMQNARKKLGVETMAEAVAIARRRWPL